MDIKTQSALSDAGFTGAENLSGFPEVRRLGCQISFHKGKKPIRFSRCLAGRCVPKPGKPIMKTLYKPISLLV